jgi:hypothetical protein
MRHHQGQERLRHFASSRSTWSRTWTERRPAPSCPCLARAIRRIRQRIGALPRTLAQKKNSSRRLIGTCLRIYIYTHTHTHTCTHIQANTQTPLGILISLHLATMHCSSPQKVFAKYLGGEETTPPRVGAHSSSYGASGSGDQGLPTPPSTTRRTDKGLRSFSLKVRFASCISI